MSVGRPQSTPPLGLYAYGQTNGWEHPLTEHTQGSRSLRQSSFPAGSGHHPLHHRYGESTSDERMGVAKRRSNPETQFRPLYAPVSPVNPGSHTYIKRRTYSHRPPVHPNRKGAKPAHRISDGNLQLSPTRGGGQAPGFQRMGARGGVNVADWVASSSQFQDPQFQSQQSHSQAVPDWDGSDSQRGFTVGSLPSYSVSPDVTPPWDDHSFPSDASGMLESLFRHQPHPRPPSSASAHFRPSSVDSAHPRSPSSASTHSRPLSVDSAHPRPPSSASAHSRPSSVDSAHPRPPSSASAHSHPQSVGSTYSHPPSDSAHSRPTSSFSMHSHPSSVSSAHSHPNSVLPFPSDKSGRRATSPNLATRGEAWQLEDDDFPSEFRGRRTTISHLDEVVASRIHRHYFHTSPTSPSSPPHPQPPTTTTTIPNHTITGDRPMSPYRDLSKGQPPYENTVASPQRGPYIQGQDPRGVSAAETARQQSRRIISNLEHRATSPTPQGFGEVNERGRPSPVDVGPEAQPVQYHHSYALTQSHPSKYHQSNYNQSHQSTSSKHETNLPTTDSLSDTDLDQLPKRIGKGSPHPMRQRSRSKSSPNQRIKNRGEMRLFSVKKRNKTKDSEKKVAGSELSETQKRRISSPEGVYTPQLMQKYFVSSEDSPDEQVMSDSETSLHKSPQSKTSGSSLVFQKLARKLGKLKGGESTAASGSSVSSGDKDKSTFRMSRKKSRSQSAGTMEGVDGPEPLSRSLEQLSPEPSDRLLEGIKAFSTPGATPTGTPTGTPKMPRSWSKTKLGRRGSGPDPELEGALPSLFKAGSKKNLAMDPSEILFEYIEQGNVEGVQQLLEANMVPDLNATNENDFTPVDLASMLNQTAIAKMLLSRGAKDSAKFCRDPFSRFTRITALLMESERELDSLKCELVTQSAGNSSVKDLERRLRKWEWRAHLFRKMKTNYEHADVPHPPTHVSLHVTSSCSLNVRWAEPEDTNGAVVTRYRIEWCRSELFAPIVGEFVMTDLRTTEYAIPDLNKGERYHVRISAFNMRGFGPAQMATPPSAVPSSWHDVGGSHPRFEGSTDNIHVISAQLSMTLSNSPPLSPTHNGAPTFNSRRTVKKGISKIFGSGVKFIKAPKPSGVHLASLVYSDDSKVLVTVDDNIPIVEVSDSHSSAVGVDFVWLAKIACTWDHIRGMCSVSNSYVSSPAVQFRNRLLHAILDLQGVLGMQDLGLLHPVPYKDSHGAITFVMVQYLKDARSMQSSSLKWVGLPRLWKKRPQPGSGEGLERLSIPDQLVLDAQEIIAHHGNTTRPLAKGLYLGYLKARSSLASMKVICSREYPNVLPHIRIRDNPNISSEEWAWLKSLSSPSHLSHAPHTSTGSQSLQKLLLPTIDTFLHNLGISKEDAEKHQLYHHEVIELNEGISLLLLLPPYEQICTAPGSSDHFANIADFIALPINTFEIMQLYTYQKAFMTKFSMVSARLDIELLTSQQRMREAFSKDEVTAAKHLQNKLEGFQERTDQAWKQMRWIEEALQRGRSLSLGADSLTSVRTLREAIKARPPNGLAIKRASSVQTVHRAGPSSGFLRVFPAYETGLVRGTSVKLYITLKTTVSEVIRLVVQQLEKARYDRGIPTRQLMEDDLSDFYLVAISNSKEWLLDKDFNPLQLQSQSSRCRLFVKRHSEDMKIDATSV